MHGVPSSIRAYIAAEFPLVALAVRERPGCVLEDADRIRWRAEAVKLRARLVERCITAGAADLVVIGLPKGDKKPVFNEGPCPTGSFGSEQCLMPMLVEHQSAGAGQDD